jgi:hypothetical protein
MKSGLWTSLLVVFLLSFSQCDETPEPLLACARTARPATGSIVPVGSTIELQWSAVDGAQVYDLYIGATGTTPILVASDLAATTFSFNVPDGAGANYTWVALPKGEMLTSQECTTRTSTFTSRPLPSFAAEQIEVDVLVINYDPEMKFGDDPNPPLLHEFYSWGNPRDLAESYIADVLTASGGHVKYNVVEWKDVNEFPRKKDGFRYDAISYLSCYASNNLSSCHNPDELDYYWTIEEHGVAEMVSNDLVDEVWIFGAPYFGFWEAAMAGPRSFFINGGIYDRVPSTRAFAIMGFNYERGPAEMLHDLSHRTEATMSMIYGGWQANQLTSSWAKFAANLTQSGTAAVGSCHWPPNAEADYDYANMKTVLSTADDWYNYPYLIGKQLPVNAMTWFTGESNPEADFQRDYLRWWFSHLPRREGTAPDGKLNNWWRYVFEFNETALN